MKIDVNINVKYVCDGIINVLLFLFYWNDWYEMELSDVVLGYLIWYDMYLV